jgi:hypothetical protein
LFPKFKENQRSCCYCSKGIRFYEDRCDKLIFTP